jgi:tetratricopeptide (TPR) repeat protein
MNRKERRAGAKAAPAPGESAPSVAGLYAQAVQLYRAGRLAEAEGLCRRLLAAAPRHPGGVHLLGLIALSANQPGPALELFEKALELQPDYPDALNSRGVVLRRAGRHEEAAAAYRRAVELQPDHLNALNNLGNVLAHLGQAEEAVSVFKRALALKPELAEAHSNLGAALRAHGQAEEAVAELRQAVSLKPDFPEALNNLGAALRSLGRPGEAVAVLRRAIELKPDFIEAWANLANVQEELGETAEALATVRRALAIDPTSAHAWHTLSGLKTFAADDPDIPAMEAALATAEARDLRDDRINLGFALGKAWMDLRDPDRAFEYLNTANRLRRATFDYDVEAEARGFDEIAKVFTPELMQRLAGTGDASELPIFVLGMPRSGTTLVEQILASHPVVHGAGELKVLEETLIAAAGRGDIGPLYPYMAQTLTPAALAKLGRAYVDQVAALAPGKERVVDKMPANFRLAGLIHLMLPNARIIHCRRDPVDTCLSCYAQNFAVGQRFTFDLRELGLYYRAYERLMAHWRTVLPPDRFLEVDYEEVVDDLEGQARRLIAFCGLPWDEACLKFYETRRPVRTASVSQVRQPIYRSSVARWKPYERQLAPLIQALAPAQSQS